MEVGTGKSEPDVFFAKEGANLEDVFSALNMNECLHRRRIVLNLVNSPFA